MEHAVRKAVVIPEELQERLQSFADLPDDHSDRVNLIMEIATSWANTDPVEAFLWADSLELPEGLLVSRSILSLMRKNTSPAEAFETVSNLDGISSELRANGQLLTLDSWAQNDFAAAWEAAAGAGIDPDYLNEIRQHLLTENAGNTEATADALLKLPAAAFENGKFNGAAAMIARSLVRNNLSSEETRDETGEFVETPATDTDMAKPAIDWALKLPEGGLRTSALSGVLSEWVMADPVGASTWLGGFPSGTEKDAMIEQMTALARAPDISFQWAAEAMTDGDARQRVLHNSSASWLAFDPEAAKRAIDSSPKLTDAERTSVYESWAQIAPLIEGKPSSGQREFGLESEE